jgi:hypothetical protein
MPMMKRITHVIALAMVLCGWTNDNPNGTIKQLKIGGGGFITGIDVNPTDGMKLARTDTYGAYKWNADNSTWVQLNTKFSMPAANFGFYPPATLRVAPSTGLHRSSSAAEARPSSLMLPRRKASKSSNFRPARSVYQGGGNGVYEITSAPSNSSIIYVAMAGGPLAGRALQGHVFKSTNGGASFTDTNFDRDCTSSCYMTEALRGRHNGRKMAVDPVNASVVYLGTQANGVWVTTDGNNWSQISSSSIPIESEYAIAFDPSDNTGNTAYICAASSGVYVSTNAASGTSSRWTLTTSGGPTSCQHLIMAAHTGIVLIVDGAAGNLWEYSGGTRGTWTENPGSLSKSWHSVAVDPANCASISTCHVVLGQNSGSLISASTGNLTGWTAAAASRSCANDVGWLCTTNEFFMTNGDMVFDVSGGTLNFVEGIGVWNGTPSYSGSTFNWNARSQGIENLVTWSNIIAPNGVAILGVQDRGITSVQNPTSYLNNSNLFVLGQAINLSNSTAVDYASTNPSFMVAQVGPNSGPVFDWSATSSDGGTTWIPFNSWNAMVQASTQISNNGSGLVRVTGISTTGLTTWSNGTGSIVTVLQQGQKSNSANLSTRSYEVTIPSTSSCTNCIDLQHSSYISADSATAAGNYLIFVPTRPSSTLNGSYLIQNIGNDGSGHIQLTINSGLHNAPANGTLINVTGTTCCDGWWIASGTSGDTTILQDSTYASGWSGAGQIGAVTMTGGSIAAATTKNFIRIPEGDEYPYCTTDGGKTWTEIGVSASGSPHYSTISNASWSSGTVTFTTNGNVNIPSSGTSNDKSFYVTGVTPSGYNGQYAATGGSGNIVTASLARDPGRYSSGGTLSPGGPSHHGTGWGWAHFLNQHIVAADRMTANTFYMYNYNVASIYQVTNCIPTQVAGSVVTPGSSYAAFSNFNTQLTAVPGQSGHLFFAVGESGGGGASHPASVRLWRSCNAGTNMQQVTGLFEPWSFGFGAAAPGKSYPSIYVFGWYSADDSRDDAVWGLWRSIDDPNNGVGGIGSASTCTLTGNTWQILTDWPLGWQAGPTGVTGSLNVYGQVFIGNGNGFAYGQFNYLFEHDLDPAISDGSPMWLNVAA